MGEQWSFPLTYQSLSFSTQHTLKEKSKQTTCLGCVSVSLFDGVFREKPAVEEEAIPTFVTTLTSGDLSTAQLQDVSCTDVLNYYHHYYLSLHLHVN